MFVDLYLHLRNILFLLGPERRKLPRILASFLLVALFDVVGLAIVGVYIALVTRSDVATSGPIFHLIRALNLGNTDQNYLILGVMLVGIFCAKTVLAIYVQRRILIFSADQAVILRKRLSQSIFSMPYEEFISRNSAKFLEGLIGHTGQFSLNVISLLRLAAEGLIAVGIVIFLITVNALAILALVCMGTVVFMVYDRVTSPGLTRAGRERIEGSELAIKSAHEAVWGQKELRIAKSGSYFVGQITRGYEVAARANVFVSLMSVVPRYLIELVIIIFVVLAFFLLLLQGGDPKNTYPMIGMLGVAALRLGPAIGMVLQAVAGVRSSFLAVSELKERVMLLTDAPDLLVEHNANPAEDFKILELRKVGFTYRNSRSPALSGVSLTVSSGESIGLIGASGAGKTTMVDVILGLLPHQVGEILYNQEPLSERLEEWWSKVAYLPQEIFLTDASLRENVALGISTENIENARVDKAILNASLGELVSGLPEGLETIVGERGLRLSGGQRQRVALARALYHQREILVLDESTSALDSDTEQEVVEAIQQLRGIKTMIVIAHRLSTLRHCDRIYRLDRGQVVAVSSYKEAVI
jgi:ATP-binding cassette, subfamily B, bacterial PglK